MLVKAATGGWHAFIAYYDVMTCEAFPHYWPFLRRIYRSPINSGHKGPAIWRSMFCLLLIWKSCQKTTIKLPVIWHAKALRRLFCHFLTNSRPFSTGIAYFSRLKYKIIFDLTEPSCLESLRMWHCCLLSAAFGRYGKTDVNVCFMFLAQGHSETGWQ